MVLAAGRGVRMRSEKPKVLHEVAGRPILDRVLDVARQLAGDESRIVVVVGAGREQVAARVAQVAPGARVAVQEPPRGTGDAVRCALPSLGGGGDVVILSGDAPLMRAATLGPLLEQRRGEVAVAFLTALLPDGGSYGRVVRDATGAVLKNVEAVDADEAQLAIREVNAGFYVFERRFLEEELPRLTAGNAKGEYYLTDLLGSAVAAGRKLVGIAAADADDISGVNSRAELARADAVLRRRAAEAALAGGATLIRPETITLDDTVVLEPDTVVEPFATLRGQTIVGSGTRIGQGSVIADSVFGRGALVKPYCVIDGARVGDGAIVGPFARLREGTELAEGVHVGNFVETKKARLGRGVKANHLTYLGDTVIGERTNVGAGVITCNYDGFAKHETVVGADVFVGSDVQLVAPVTVGDGAIIGAGTTVTRDVPGNAITTARAPQVNREGMAEGYRAKKRGVPKAR